MQSAKVGGDCTRKKICNLVSGHSTGIFWIKDADFMWKNEMLHV
jgi:hypothetical protein